MTQACMAALILFVSNIRLWLYYFANYELACQWIARAAVHKAEIYNLVNAMD